jgi:riboflavin-specific deaminase-like protein
MPEGALNRTASTIACLVQSVLKERAGNPPVVTVSWAQSSDGAIARRGGERVILSSPESMALTHRLRSLHGAILVGIGTVVADDPLLTVRLVDGPSPQPVVLDSMLRFPDSARLLSRTDRAPWIFHADGAPAPRARELEGRGARLFPLSAGKDGLPLDEMLRVLAAHGIRSLMVEGGGRVLRSFMTRGLAEQAVITVSPSTLEGVAIFEGGAGTGGLPGFKEMSREQSGIDTVIWGRFGSGAG